MKAWSRLTTMVLSAICSSAIYATTLFDEDRGWTILIVETAGIPFACVAEKQLQNVKISITPALIANDPYFILSTTLRADQKLKAPALDIFFDERKIQLSRKQIALTSGTIDLLVKFSDTNLEQFGTTNSFQINLSPHTRINLESPTYAMYLLEECVRTINVVTHQNEMSAITQRQFPSLANQVSTSQEANTKPITRKLGPSEITKQDGIKQTGLPLNFEEFVKAMSMVDASKIQFLPLDEAKAEYDADWIDAGWTGDKQLIFGIGYVTNARSKDLIEYWSRELESDCQSMDGEATSKDLGIRRAENHRAHVAYTLCRLEDGWLTLSKTAYDMQSKSFGLTEAKIYDDSHRESLGDWFNKLK